MSDSEQESYLALFDVLGFASKIKTSSIQDMISSLQHLEYIAGTKGVQSIVFSDTVLLYTIGTNPQDLYELVEHCCKLVAECNRNDLMLRGAITRGEFYHERQIFLGKAMVTAYYLEQSQEWMGAVMDRVLVDKLDHSDNPGEQRCWKELRDHQLLIPYRAPLKDGPAGNLWCLGWPKYGDKQRRIAPAAPDDAHRKAANTDEFVEKYKEWCI